MKTGASTILQEASTLASKFRAGRRHARQTAVHVHHHPRRRVGGRRLPPHDGVALAPGRPPLPPGRRSVPRNGRLGKGQHGKGRRLPPQTPSTAPFTGQVDAVHNPSTAVLGSSGRPSRGSEDGRPGTQSGPSWVPCPKLLFGRLLFCSFGMTPRPSNEGSPSLGHSSPTTSSRRTKRGDPGETHTRILPGIGSPASY